MKMTCKKGKKTCEDVKLAPTKNMHWCMKSESSFLNINIVWVVWDDLRIGRVEGIHCCLL